MRHSAKAIVVHQGRFLLVQDDYVKDGRTVTFWDLPGGGIEEGETKEEACAREVKEETGLDVEVREFVGSYEFVTSKGLHMHCDVFRCTSETDDVDFSGNPSATEKLQSYRWLTKEEFLASDLNTFDEVRDFIRGMEI